MLKWRSAWDIPQKLLSDDGFSLKSEILRLDERRSKCVSKLMAIAIAKRVQDGFFLVFIEYELEIDQWTIVKAREEWPHVFKSPFTQRDQRGKGSNNSGPRRTPRYRSGSHKQTGKQLLQDALSYAFSFGD